MNPIQTVFIPWRFYLLICFLSVIVLSLTLRVYNLTILDRAFLKKEGDERTLRLVNKAAFRGMITDRNGSPLAVSALVYSAWINPKEFDFRNLSKIQELSTLIGIKSSQVLEINKQSKIKPKAFVYLKRGIAPDIAARLKGLNLTGLYLSESYHRYYPEGEATAQLLGFTNVDDNGQEGIELAYNEWLQGKSGKKWALKDRLGRIIADVQTVQEQIPGNELVLSIDKRIQYLAYRELLKGVIENQAVSGSAIVLDANTGEVLAMVNQPSFNPNNRKLYRKEALRNRAILDLFEPGSTIKAFSIASGLASGQFQINSIIETTPGWIRLDHNLVRDEKNNGPLSLAKILQLSSNVGVAKLILGLPQGQLWELLHQLGFGEMMGIGFPGEPNGVLERRPYWSNFTLATLSFGYGLSVTALQLTRAYAVLAKGGLKLPISLLKIDAPSSSERVLSDKVAQEMLVLLESVVEKGATGQAARLTEYRVAGKTGTTKMVGEGGYQKNQHIASFVGIAPVSKPRLVVTVVIQDPQGKHYYGGPVAGPVFKNIMEGSLRLLNIPPDSKKIES